MQRENKWKDRLKHNIYANHQSLEDAQEAFKETIERIKTFIQSEIDMAVAEEKNKTIKLLKKYSPTCGGGKCYVVEELLNLIKEQ